MDAFHVAAQQNWQQPLHIQWCPAACNATFLAPCLSSASSP